jgi:hypothetical protein
VRFTTVERDIVADESTVTLDLHSSMTCSGIEYRKVETRGVLSAGSYDLFGKNREEDGAQYPLVVKEGGRQSEIVLYLEGDLELPRIPYCEEINARSLVGLVARCKGSLPV